VFVVIGDGAQSEETRRQVRAAVAARLEDTGVIPPTIGVEVVAALPREPGHAGKFKLIESRRGESDALSRDPLWR
jgi:hypothetical protein